MVVFFLALAVALFLMTLSFLKPHRWSPETILIYDGYSNDTKDLPPPIPYRLILYADGQMFMLRDTLYDGSLGGWQTQIWTKKLNRKEICALLNTVEQVGYLDYSPSAYKYSENNQDGLLAEYIQVNSWRSKSGTFYGLGFVIEEEFVQYEVDKVLVDTYNILHQYPTEEFEVYQPEKLAIWVEPIPVWNDKELDQWPIETPSLAEISKPVASSPLEIYSDPGRSTILEGDSARLVYNAFDNSIADWGRPFSEEGAAYVVLAVPLLPYQSPPPDGEFYAPIPSAEFTSQQRTLTCSQYDGFIEIPTP